MKNISIKNKQKKKIKRNNSTCKILGLLVMPVFIFIASMPRAMAHCPLCTAATIAGLGVTRSLGWDDSIVGIFVGAVIVSSALWISNIFKRKNIGGNAFLRISSITLFTLVITILSFYYAGILGLANTYRIFGIEKVIFGAFSGIAVSFIAFFASNKIKKRNKGKVLFSYQTMILTFAALVLNSLLFWMVFR